MGLLNWPRIEKPRENNLGDQLINIQYEYLTTGSEKSWADLWKLSLDLSGRLLTDYCRKKKLSMRSDKFNEIKIEAVTRVLARFKNEKRPGYFIRSSFAYEIRMALVQVIHSETKAQRCYKIAVSKYAKDMPMDEALFRAKEQMRSEKENRK